ncbi:MAG: hypothetical protein AAGA38_13525 [Pseudomonadota bacterium]
MFARVTPYKMKPGTRDDAMALMEQLRSKIMGMPGMHNFINVMSEDGSGYVISVVESEAASNANAETVKSLWAEFAPMLEAMPVPEGYDVMANWTN